MMIRVLLLLFIALLSQVSAFGVNRRAFLGTTTSSVTAAAVVAVQPAVAEEEALYNPAPGSLTDKTIVITGGNTGLGLESAKRLAAAGAAVIVTTRTNAKGSQAVADIAAYLQQQGIQNDKISSLTMDLANFDSVKAAAKEITSSTDSNRKIDVLMCNAGVMAIPDRQLTVDGYERTFQTNHLGHFLFTAKLIPALSPNARIINVSSTAYMFAGPSGLDMNNLNAEKQYGPWSSYGQSKLANILFTQELQRRADNAADNKAYTVTALHPGAVATDLGRYLVGEDQWNKMKTDGIMTWQQKLLLVPLSKFTKTVPIGANTQIYLAADPVRPVPGAFYDNLQPVTNLPPFARDVQAAQTLWQVSEQMTGTTFAL